MAREYYNTKEKIYKLLKKHPATASYISEYGITNVAVMDVATYLIAHDAELQATNLTAYYQDSDLIDEIANLYGFTDKPWTKYTLKSGVTLLELLQATIYLYKFGTTDNFYEKNIFNFIPEYDREQILANPKLKLTVQGLGKKLDQLEDQITRLSDIYDIDKCPDKLLDYLGQNLGYEREDYTLSSVSFRELLKNIVEIYKIKGTNYSFSLFFKFLGFEINLKEFYYNRDVNNPCSFPGMTINDVEYYLTVTNPTKETGDASQGVYLNPAEHLEQTRNIDDWKLEFDSITAAGCTNVIKYMQGFESYNNAGVKWHSNPWTYFKTNLIEYELSSFMNKMNLTASDNETIKKYIKFLSPTYLFTWININLTPWMEDIQLIVDPDTSWIRTVNKVIGDPRPTPSPWPMFPQGLAGVPVNKTGIFNRKSFPGPYRDYEDVGEIALFKTGGDVFKKLIEKKLNYDNTDQFGTTLRHNGEHTRQPDSPKYIADAHHYAKKRLCFDSLDIDAKSIAAATFTSYTSSNLPPLPSNIVPKSGKIITLSNIPEFSWDTAFNATHYWLQVATSSEFSDTDTWRTKNIVIDKKTSSPYFTESTAFHNNKYYWRLRVRNKQLDYYDSDINGNNWKSYTYTPASGYVPASYVHTTGWSPWSDIYSFTIDTVPFPYHGEEINKDTAYVTSLYQYNAAKTVQIFTYATLSLKWKSSLRVDSYEIEFTDGSTSVNALKNAKAAVTLYKNTIIEAETAVNSTQSNVLKIQTEHSTLTTELTSLQSSYTSAVERLNADQIVSAEALANLNTVSEKFNVGLATQEELDAATESYSTTLTVIQEDQDTCTSLSNSINNYQMLIVSKNSELTAAQTALTNAQAELTAAQASLSAAQSTLASLDQTATELSGFTGTFTSSSNSLSKNLTNGNYYWRYRTKDIDGVYNDWSNELHFIISFVSTK